MRERSPMTFVAARCIASVTGSLEGQTPGERRPAELEAG